MATKKQQLGRDGPRPKHSRASPRKAQRRWPPPDVSIGLRRQIQSSPIPFLEDCSRHLWLAPLAPPAFTVLIGLGSTVSLVIAALLSSGVLFSITRTWARLPAPKRARQPSRSLVKALAPFRRRITAFVGAVTFFVLTYIGTRVLDGLPTVIVTKGAILLLTGAALLWAASNLVLGHITASWLTNKDRNRSLDHFSDTELTNVLAGWARLLHFAVIDIATRRRGAIVSLSALMFMVAGTIGLAREIARLVS